MKMRYDTDPEHRRKQRARVRVRDLEKPEVCEECGGPNPQAHHPDYDKPFEVHWLCRACHLKLHNNVSIS